MMSDEEGGKAYRVRDEREQRIEETAHEESKNRWGIGAIRDRMSQINKSTTTTDVWGDEGDKKTTAKQNNTKTTKPGHFLEQIKYDMSQVRNKENRDEVGRVGM